MALVKVTPLVSIALMNKQGRNTHLSSKAPFSSPEWLFSLLTRAEDSVAIRDSLAHSDWWGFTSHFHGVSVLFSSHILNLWFTGVAQHKMPWWKLWQFISWLTGSPVSVQCRWQKEMEAIMSTSIKLFPVVIQILKQPLSCLDHAAQYSQQKLANFNIYPRKTWKNF